jgi:hypothetical protein
MAQDDFSQMEVDRLKRIERNEAMLKIFEVRWWWLCPSQNSCL